MRMLRWMCGITKKDNIGNEHVMISKAAPIAKKLAEKRLKWYGHVRSRLEGYVLRRMVDDVYQGRDG